MINYDRQTTHENLVHAINKAYGKKVFKVKKKPVSLSAPSDYKNLHNDVHHTVALITQTLNLTGGSVDRIDLYKLLINYICDKSIREKINEII